jgi:hypothetical protein
MKTCFSDPTLREVLSDPLIRTIMAADSVDPQRLEAQLRGMASTIARRSSSARSTSIFACCT